jgi:limonene-1,2-epoxide hydrolase
LALTAVVPAAHILFHKHTLGDRAMLRLFLIALAFAVPVARLAAKEPVMHSDPKAVVQTMIDAWDHRDWKKVTDLFTDNGVLHSMMIEPIVGKEAIGKRIDLLGAGIGTITLHIHNMAVTGNTVFIERTDEFTFNGHAGKVPVVGVLEVEGDKIKSWREYYDRAELVAAMGLAQDFHQPSAPH